MSKSSRQSLQPPSQNDDYRPPSPGRSLRDAYRMARTSISGRSSPVRPSHTEKSRSASIAGDPYDFGGGTETAQESLGQIGAEDAETEALVSKRDRGPPSLVPEFPNNPTQCEYCLQSALSTALQKGDRILTLMYPITGAKPCWTCESCRDGKLPKTEWYGSAFIRATTDYDGETLSMQMRHERAPGWGRNYTVKLSGLQWSESQG